LTPRKSPIYTQIVKLKFNFKITAFLIAVAILACRPFAPRRPGVATEGGDAQRIVALVDYVKGDYPGAVRDGEVLAPSEYEEQQRFVADARTLAAHLVGGEDKADPLLRGLDDLGERVKRKADPEEVQKACLEVRDRAIERFHLATTPSERPSLGRAQAAYTLSCARCHGADGSGETDLPLDPKPARFRDPKRLAQLSPYRVYNALTFGVPGTAMPSFDSLSPSERWDLAFYVFRLGHEGESAQGGPDLPLPELAIRSDRELLASLWHEPKPQAALAYLRREAPFAGPLAGASLERTRVLLQKARSEYHAGRAPEADRAALDAYLQGFEPLEAPLRVRSPQGTAAAEGAFRDLRAAIAKALPPDAIDAAEGQVEADLQALEDRSRPPALPAAASAMIFFREGLEAALLVGALLAGVRKLGRPDAAPYLHAGWILALPAGVLTWFAFARILLVGSDQRELMEGLVSLLASAVLFSVSFWMISKAESRHWMSYLKRSLEEGLSRKRLLLLAGLAFLAVYREAAETVLFLQALLLESPAERSQILLGAVLGIGLVAMVAILMNRTVLRLPIGPFFGVSSLLLCALAISFAGEGVYILVASGYLPPRPVRFPEVGWMGIHPDLTGLVVQLVILSVVLGAGIHTLLRRVSDEGAAPRP
jgi:high-affinity iron transporter